jgi:phosphate uptake regulator
MIRSFGETHELSLLLLRCLNVLRIQFEATKNVIRTRDEQEITAIIRRDDDIDRFRLLIERQTHRYLIDAKDALGASITLVESLHISQIAKFAERAGDHLLQLAEKIRVLPEDLPQDVLLNAFASTETILLKTIDLVTKKDLKTCFDVFSSGKDTIARWAKENYLTKTMSSFGHYFLHLERIVDYCLDIIEIIIDSDMYAELDNIS